MDLSYPCKCIQMKLRSCQSGNENLLNLIGRFYLPIKITPNNENDSVLLNQYRITLV